MKDFFISIIIPVYNAQNYITRCLNSIISQTYSEFECILVDDYSNDNSFEICKKFSQNDMRFKIIKNQDNIGASLSRNVGFVNSIGKYIQFIDADDYIENDMIEKMYNKAQNENLDMVTCDFYDQCYKNIYIDEISDKIKKIKDIAANFEACAVWNKLVKRDILNKIIFPDTSYCEDRFITLQTIFYSNSFGHVNIPLYHYTTNPNSTTNNNLKYNRIIDLFKSCIYITDFLKDKYKDISFLEPELSQRINNVKEIVFESKIPKRICNISKLYPKSKFSQYIFKHQTRKLLKKILPEFIQVKIKKSLIK